jgi:predicted GIY-YIG superfamily endonuclease
MSYGSTKKKGGWVYIGESTRADGSKKLYTGITRRSPTKRWGEHIASIKKKRW